MRIALIGCGYVADFYAATLPNHPQLELVGVADRDSRRLSQFSNHYAAHPSRHSDFRTYASNEELLDDSSIELVVNLTNPDSHFEVSRASLEAGKHVYSEKPLAMQLERARELVELAKRRGLGLSSAPCNVLGESAQTAWKALRQDRLGEVYLAYAELDDGLIHRTNFRDWKSESGAPWPYRDEFETGCTLEHAGYYLCWLAAFFGPAQRVTAFSAQVVRDKHTEPPLDAATPDFSVACIEFESGVVARLTCSIASPPDRSLRIIGEQGVLMVNDCWDFGSPVRFRQRTPFAIRLEKSRIGSRFIALLNRKLPLVRKPSFQFRSAGATAMDFCAGVAELAASITEQRPCRLSADYSLHVNELTLAIQNPDELGTPYRMTTSFDPVAAMPWAS